MAAAGGKGLVRGRYALSLSSWFCLPEQGMKDFEILSRASAFLVKANSNDKFEHKYHIVTSSHVVSPWKWPKYYPLEWLKHVNESHTHYTVELRFPDGIFQTVFDCLPFSFHHPSRDLAVLHLMNEPKAIETLRELEYQISELATKDEFDNHHLLEFQGHDVTGDVTEEVDLRVPIPRNVMGEFYARTHHQTFAKSDSVLVDGMCGGPVLVDVNTSNGKKVTKVGGVLEGIIPTTHPEQKLQGLACFFESKDINTFIRDVEQGKVKPLQGGKSLLHVSRDQDPSKMNLEDIFKKFEQ